MTLECHFVFFALFFSMLNDIGNNHFKGNSCIVDIDELIRIDVNTVIYLISHVAPQLQLRVVGLV